MFFSGKFLVSSLFLCLCFFLAFFYYLHLLQRNEAFNLKVVSRTIWTDRL